MKDGMIRCISGLGIVVGAAIVSSTVDDILKKWEEARTKKEIAKMEKLLDNGDLMDRAYYNAMCHGSGYVNGLSLKERTMAEYKRLKEEAV